MTWMFLYDIIQTFYTVYGPIFFIINVVHRIWV